ncbi:MAG TPA: DUF2127 domain-containing protein [Vicinamibacterales bacterium]|nr:DUF2127 domain-containing protein [Vicinamibacterales bacterium]
MALPSERARATWRGAATLRLIAIFEAAKGIVVLAAGSGLLLLVHRDLQSLADRIVRHFHLNPASRESRILYRALTQATPGQLKWLAAAAVAYAVFRFAEAWGLWRARRWAEWLGAVTGLFYVPFEIFSFIRQPRPVPVVALAINLAIVFVLARRLQLADGTKPMP